MYLFFDTETTGFPRNWRAPITDLNNWPRLVQIAWILYDEEGNEFDTKDFIIKPDGYRIPKASTNIHGISMEKAMEEGIPVKEALLQFSNDVDKSTTIVAHNLDFDEKVTGSELYRAGISHNLFKMKRICTMKATVDFCKIEGRYGYKWPKLSELHMLLFGEGFEEEHNAAADIRATAKCFWALKEKGHL